MVLTTAGASIVVIGGGLALHRALSSDISKARQPWASAGENFSDPRLNALSYAILAPNPHNRQPWLVSLDDDVDSLTLTCDLTRLLPETDPGNRQIVIGLGAFLELLRQAAAESGYRLDVTPFPDGEPQPILDTRPIAKVKFIEDASVEKDPLFGFALKRRTVRTPFDLENLINIDIFKKLDGALQPTNGDFEWVDDQKNVEALRDICNRAWLVEVGTKRTHLESTALTRVGANAINENPDGISLSGPFFEASRLTGFMSEEKMNNTESRTYAGTVKFYQDLIDSATTFGWLSTSGNTRRDQLNAGAGWVRLHLAATKENLAMHPLSQVLQEFPEMTELYEEFHGYLRINDPSRVQGLFRFGYAKFPQPSPRWPLESRLLNA